MQKRQLAAASERRARQREAVLEEGRQAAVRAKAAAEEEALAVAMRRQAVVEANKATREDNERLRVREPNVSFLQHHNKNHAQRHKLDLQRKVAAEEEEHFRRYAQLKGGC